MEWRIDGGNTCIVLMDRSMNKFKTSDFNPTMVASRTFDSILQQIQSSNLNFQLQISPFAANISLKRSPVKDRTGTPILQPKLPSQSPSETVAEIAVLASKNIQLEKDLNSLGLVHEGAIEDCEAAYNKIRLLESNPIVKTEDNKKQKMELSKKDELLNDLSSKLSQVSVENEHLKMKLDKQSSEIQNLQKSSKEISNKLNKELVSTKVKFQAEKEEILKQHKAEVKSWRQELGEVKKNLNPRRTWQNQAQFQMLTQRAL